MSALTNLFWNKFVTPFVLWYHRINRYISLCSLYVRFAQYFEYDKVFVSCATCHSSYVKANNSAVTEKAHQCFNDIRLQIFRATCTWCSPVEDFCDQIQLNFLQI